MQKIISFFIHVVKVLFFEFGLSWTAFLRRGLPKHICISGHTYPFLEISDTKLDLFDEIIRFPGSRSAAYARFDTHSAAIVKYVSGTAFCRH